jgi:predicted permease
VAAIAVCVSLAIGVGGNLALLLVSDALFWRKLPVRAPEELARIVSSRGDVALSSRAWAFLRDHNPHFRQVFAYSTTEFTSHSSGGPGNTVSGAFTSGEMFAVLGLQAEHGRLLTVADDAGGEPLRAVISFALWHQEFGGRPSVLREHIELEGLLFEVVGVAPRAFLGLEIGRRADVFVPLASRQLFRARASVEAGDGGWLQVYARIPPTRSLSTATDALRAWQPVLRAETAPRVGSTSAYLSDALAMVEASGGISFLRREYSTASAILSGIALIALAIGAINVAALMVGRVIDRRTEIATCLALGAKRWRLLAELTFEVVAVVSTSVAVSIWLSIRSAEQLVPYLTSASLLGSEPFLVVEAGWRLWGAAIFLVIVLSALIAALPGVLLYRTQVQQHLGGASRTVNPRSTSLVNVALCSQVLFSVVLLCVAMLLVRSFAALVLRPAGLDTQRVLIASVSRSFTEITVPDRAKWTDVIRDALARIPGVQEVAVSMVTPLSGLMAAAEIDVPNSPSRIPAGAFAPFNRVSPAFFDVFGIPLLAGRDFSKQDTAGTTRVVIINRAFADVHYFGTLPVGQTINVGQQPARIVGVVANSAQRTLREERPVPMAYGPLAQWLGGVVRSLRFSLRAEDPHRLRDQVSAAIARVDPQSAIQFRTLEDQASDSVNRERLLAWIGGAFALFAFITAMLGLYGTFLYQIERRKSEYAVRIAIGAEPSAITWLVLRRAVIITGIGSLLGIVVIRAISPVIGALLFSVEPTEVWTTLGSISTVLLAVCAASYRALNRIVLKDVTATLRMP